MRRLTSALLAGVLALGAAAPAYADHKRDRNWNYSRDRDWNDRDYRDGYKDARRDDRRDDRRDHRNNRGWYDGRGNHHYWNRGDHFDRRYNTRYVVVNDYRNYRDHNGYRLRAPSYGERYYRNSDTGEILLIAAATGLVLWALNN